MVKTTETEFHKIPSEDSDRVFTGTVYGPDGQPVAGAIVWAARLKISLPSSPKTTTNREGRFSLKVKG